MYLDFLLILEEIGAAIVQAIRSLMGVFAALLYNFIVDLYNVFMIIARVQILNDDYIQSIYNKVGIILGLFMVFKLSFSLIQSLVSPEKLTDKKNGYGNIIIRSVVSIVLLGITPYLFRVAFDFQDMVVGTRDDTTNVIYKLIVSDNSKQKASSFGRTLATDLYFCFFRESTPGILTGDPYSIVDDNGNLTIGIFSYDVLKSNVESGNTSFYDLIPYLHATTSSGRYKIEWDLLFSIVVAVVVIWIFINYCLAVATRVVQLAYLQLIAPIPILSYISNPDGAFKKWIKQCTTTYLDLFMRVAIIYFIITLCGFAMDIYNDPDKLLANATLSGLNPNSRLYIWVKIFTILGLFMFGKRVPELLKDLFPGDGKFDLGIKSPKKFFDDIPGLRAATTGVGLGAVGAVVSAKSRYTSNRANGKSVGKSLLGGLNGLTSGLYGGVKSGVTKKGFSGGWKNMQTANNKYNELITSGGTTIGTIKARVGNTLGESKGQKYTREMSNYQTVIDFNSDINNKAESFSVVKDLKNKWDTLRINGASDEEVKAAYKTYKNAKKAAITAALNGDKDFSYGEVSYSSVDNEAENFSVVKDLKNTWENLRMNGESDEKVKVAYENYSNAKAAAIKAAIKGDKVFSYNEVGYGPDGKKTVFNKNVSFDSNDESLATAINGSEDGVITRTKVINAKFDKFEDQAVSAQINVKGSEAQTFVKSHNVVLNDASGKAIELKDYQSFADASASASLAQTEILKREDYPGAIASDKAVGNDSSKTSHKGNNGRR